MTKDVRRDSLPEIYFYGYRAGSTESTNWTGDVVIAKGDLRQEFQIATYDRTALSALLKVCIFCLHKETSAVANYFSPFSF